MGGGYSNSFVGTAGAIGGNQFHQLSLTDALPVRKKSSDIGVGGAGSAVIEDSLEVTSKMILATCERCRLGEIPPTQFIIWLEQILNDSKVRMNRTLRATINKFLPQLKTSIEKAAFYDILLRFESALRGSN